MNFLVEMWAIIASGVISWFSSLDNNVLATISNLLTILVISIGLIDWLIRKKRSRANKQTDTLDVIESTQRSFRAVNMLNNPMETSEKIGTIIEDTTKMLGGKNMKKVFKWIWYNKEQLLSIVYNVAIITFANFLMWTDMLNGLIEPVAGAGGALAIKIVAIVASVLFAALDVRNVCVKYGLSSLATIDEILATRATEVKHKLTPEQKATYKNSIATLRKALEKEMVELLTAEDELKKMTTLYEADASLVANYATQCAEFEKKIATIKPVIANIESKIAEFEAKLSGEDNAVA